MTLLIDWDDKTYDVDPLGFSMRELDLIEQRTGMSWRKLVVAAYELSPNAVRALFWVVDQRREPALKYSEYDGPPITAFLAHLDAYAEIMASLGKRLRDVARIELEAEEPSGTGGSDESPSIVDTPPSSTTP